MREDIPKAAYEEFVTTYAEYGLMVDAFEHWPALPEVAKMAWRRATFVALTQALKRLDTALEAHKDGDTHTWQSESPDPRSGSAPVSPTDSSSGPPTTT